MGATEQKHFETLDVYISAFLHLAGIFPDLQIKNNRVIFAFPHSDDLYRVMSNYNSNVNTPVADYVTAVKTLRGKLLSMRGQR